MTQEKKFIPCLMGPTASGKTALAYSLCDSLADAIVSVDSALVYKTMDIGTAKPNANELQRYPHYLINCCDPSESYSAAQFALDAHDCLSQLCDTQQQPLLVGGTMLYFKALQQGLSDLPGANPVIRRQLEQQAIQQGWVAMHEELAKVDPHAAARIHPNDPQRIQRALEVYQLTGKSLTAWQQEKKASDSRFCYINIAIAPDNRDQLHQRIEKRFHDMLSQGLIDEVERLHQRRDLNADLPALRAVGYRQVWQYLEGELTFEEMTERAIIATRQLAKRQLTWLRRWPNLHWFNSDDPKLAENIIQWLRPKLS